MALQYKPTKQKKEKPVKEPKTSKAEKPVSFGSANAVKFDKPKKVKEKKIKTPKPEKAEVMSFTPSKAEKASDLNKGGSVLKKSIKPAVAISIASGVILTVVLVAVLALVAILPAIEKHGQKLDSIMISSTPDKIIYLVGEEANYDGLRITVTRKNGETFTVRASDCQITGFDSSEPKQMVIAVTYEGLTTDFSIKVEEVPHQVPPLTGIHLDPLPKTEYKLGEPLDTTDGVIIREYADGSTAKAVLMYSYVYGFEGITKPGEYTLIVEYIENGITAETTYTITVTE